MRVILVIGFVIATWRFGDWRNWQKYHPTILYFTLGGLLYNVVLHHYLMWQYAPDGIIPNHTLSAVALALIVFPCTVLLYLPFIPKTTAGKVMHILKWGAIYAVIEFIMWRTGLITYHNGWSYVTSALFDFGIFVMLLIHQTRPLLAYVLSFVIVICLMLIYKVPINSMK